LTAVAGSLALAGLTAGPAAAAAPTEATAPAAVEPAATIEASPEAAADAAATESDEPTPSAPAAEPSAPAAEPSAPAAAPSAPAAEPSAPAAEPGPPAQRAVVSEPAVSAARAPAATPPGRVQARRRGRRLAGAQTEPPNSPDRDAHSCTIRGDGRSNHLVGTEGDDVICGGGGDDRIEGLGGRDVIRGGPGNDTIDGGDGDDFLDGGPSRFGEHDPHGHDYLSCGSGYDAFASRGEGEVAAADCEQPLFSFPAGSIQERISVERPPEPTPVSRGGGLGPVDAPARAGLAIGALRRLVAAGKRGPVAVAERELVVEDGAIRLDLECLAGSLDRSGGVTLVGLRGGSAELAAARFRCDRIGRIAVELRASPELERLLEGGKEVRARLVVRLGRRTKRVVVTVTASAP
jgi:hypothetical protein